VVERKLFASTMFDHQPDHLLVHFPGRAHKREMMICYLNGDYERPKQLYEYEMSVMDIYRKSKAVKKVKLIGKPLL
jgi:hypothetical protein